MRRRAESYFIKARDLERRGMTQLANRYLQSAYALDPQSNVLRELLVDRYINSGKYREAILLIKNGKRIKQLSHAELRLLAKVYFHIGDFKQAAATLAMIPDKNDQELLLLALIYEAEGASEKALALYREYHRRRPSSLEVGLKITQLLFKTRHFAEAESLLIDLSDRFTNNPAILNALGIGKLAVGDTTLALSSFETALLVDSLYEDALGNAATIFLHQGNTAKARRYYERLASLQPGNVAYATMLMRLYYLAQQFEEARAIATRLLGRTDINDSYLHYFLGLIAAAQNDTDVAILEFEKAIALDAAFSNAWRQLCYLYIRYGRLDDALATAIRFTNKMAESCIAWRILGVVYNARKEYNKAIEVLYRATRCDSMDYAAWFEMGSALERQGKIDSASIAFRRVLNINPQDAAAANYLGYMWAEHGINLDSALVLLNMALSLEPENGAYLDSYAWIFYQKGHYDQALIYIQKALQHIHDDPVVFEHYGDILVKLGKFSNAIDAYEQSLKLSNGQDAERIRNKLGNLRKQFLIE